MKKRKIYLIVVYTIILFFYLLLPENDVINNERENKDDNNSNKTLLSVNNPPIVDWFKTWDGGLDDWGGAIALDSSENILLVGTTYSFGIDDYDTCLVKYDSSGLQQWYQGWGGDIHDQCRAIAIDTSDNIYLGVLTWDLSTGDGDISLVKYNCSGVQMWNKTGDGDPYDFCNAIALDSVNNIYIAGSKSGDMCVVKYDSSGIEQWNRTWGGSNRDLGYAIVLDSTENIFIIGNTESFGAGNTDICLVKYNSLGEQQWNHTWGGIDRDECYAIVLDSSENIYIVGQTESFGEGMMDICVVKYDKLGTQQWNRTWGGTSYDNGYAIAIDSSDNIYITGKTSSFDSEGDDVVLVKYNSSGVQEWNRTWGGSGYDSGGTITLDSSKNIYIAGSTTSFGTGTMDMYVVKFSSTPQITINLPSHNEFFGNEAPNYDISIYVVEGNLNTTWYSLDDGQTNITFNDLTGIIDQTEWNKKGDGIITIKFYANDTMGTKGYAEVTVFKDTITPASSIYFIPYSGSNRVNKSTYFTLTADDGLGSGISVIMYKINESDWNNYNDPFNISGYAFGDYLISYHAIDKVGNTEEIKTLLVKLVDIDKEEDDESTLLIIIGYDLFISISLISIISVIVIKKRYKIFN